MNTEDLAYDLTEAPPVPGQVTAAMQEARASNVDDRTRFYLDHRVGDQRRWYASKAAEKRRRGKIWFVCFIAMHFGAISLMLTRIAWPNFTYWPVELFVVAAGYIMTWMQVNRFRELASAYALTSHEIAMLQEDAERISDNETLDQFVRDAENAFSREHTQWIARRDT